MQETFRLRAGSISSHHSQLESSSPPRDGGDKGNNWLQVQVLLLDSDCSTSASNVVAGSGDLLYHLLGELLLGKENRTTSMPAREGRSSIAEVDHEAKRWQPLDMVARIGGTPNLGASEVDDVAIQLLHNLLQPEWLRQSQNIVNRAPQPHVDHKAQEAHEVPRSHAQPRAGSST